MEHYDPAFDPPPAIWLDLDEDEQLHLVSEYHRRTRERLPNRRLHASMHVIVENQLAMGLPGVADALKRLQEEGLDRHDATHAIGSVMLEYMTVLLEAGRPWDDEMSRQYAEKLSRLTAEEWLRSWEE